jgi:hypothetical protein
MVLDDGNEMSLHVDPDAFAESVHGSELVCTDCHRNYARDHPTGATFPNRRAYALEAYETCKECHFDTYTRTLEGVHFELLRQGMLEAPVCTDCHGVHDIFDPREKHAMMSRSCGSCHGEIYQQYAASVHARGLHDDPLQQSPGCADCHTAHDIADPTTPGFHIASPELCIRCHGEEERMRRFGLTTRAATTYLADFHGVTASLADPDRVEERHLVVTCGDCHGVHDVASPDDIPAEAMKERVAQVCADCHEGAAADFPAAWLSHYRPSLRHAPLVFLVDVFYKILIPFMVVGLGLQVLLHLYRASVRR